MNVVLVGYRGTGKSTVASVVGGSLGLRVVSLDALLVERAGKPIPEIVAERGWPGFRDLEEALCREAVARNGWVIDCGGGVIEREANFEPLRRAGPVVWLRASVATIVSRIAHGVDRPSLTGAKSFTEEVAEVLERRTPLYRRIAHFEVETDGRAPDAIGREIVAYVRQWTDAAGTSGGGSAGAR